MKFINLRENAISNFRQISSEEEVRVREGQDQVPSQEFL